MTLQWHRQRQRRQKEHPRKQQTNGDGGETRRDVASWRKLQDENKILAPDEDRDVQPRCRRLCPLKGQIMKNLSRLRATLSVRERRHSARLSLKRSIPGGVS